MTAKSFRLQSETDALPSRDEYRQLMARVAALEARPAGGGLSAQPLYTDDSLAQNNGIPRFGLYRLGVGADDFRMRIRSDVPQYYYDFIYHYYLFFYHHDHYYYCYYSYYSYYYY